MTEIKGYYDFSDLSNELADKFNLSAQHCKNIVEAAFDAIARRVGESNNIVVLDNVGTFELGRQLARTYKLPDGLDGDGLPLFKEVNTPTKLKVKFRPAKAFSKLVQDNLPEELKHIKVK